MRVSRLLLAVALAWAALVGCGTAATDSGYVSGDGSVTLIPVDRRAKITRALGEIGRAHV